MISQQTLMATLYIVAMIMSLFAIISGGLLIFFRKAVFERLKMTKLVKRGYIIARLKRIDGTEIEEVLLPDKELNGVRFTGVEGVYILDNHSSRLKERKFPTYEWLEGETSPINHESEYLSTEVNCPSCKTNFNANISKPKSINPAVLDNLIMKIKTLSNMANLNKMLMIILVAIGISILVGGVSAFLIYDLKKRLAEMMRPIIIEGVRVAMQTIKNNATLIP